MEALIVTAVLLAAAKLLGKKSTPEKASSAPPNPTPTTVLQDRPPPPREPPQSPPGAPDAARLQRAHTLAMQVAQAIKAQGSDNSRELIAAFQREAGLVADGIYGSRTAGALKWYTGESIAPNTGRFDPYAPFGSAQSATAPRPPAPGSSKASAPKTTTSSKTPPKTTPQSPQTPRTTPPVPPAKPATNRPAATEQKPATNAPTATEQKPKTPPEQPSTPTAPKTEPQKPAEAKPAETPSVSLTNESAKRLDRAAALGKQVAASVKARGKSYDRVTVTAFQREAGLAADGIYGPRTAGAVKWYTGETIPPIGGGALATYAPTLDATAKPLPKVEEPTPQKKPPAPAVPAKPAPTQNAKPAPTAPIVKDRERLDRAAELAKRVLLNLKQSGAKYDRALVKQFQREAGLTPDGIYGPRSAGAVKWYTGESMPPKTGSGQFTNYVPNF
jgi:murein L,D-transpeptidase YcbB/YkuD